MSEEQKKAIEVIDYMQQKIWDYHHLVKKHDENLAMKIWECTLQIEHAVKILRGEIK
jgi:hypothetical protein